MAVILRTLWKYPALSTYQLSSVLLKEQLRYNSSTSEKNPVKPPQAAQVVISGGGVIGCSVAYHLAKIGWTDVIVLEKGSLTGGTTWHSAGVVGRLKSTAVERSILSYSTELYSKLEEEGYTTGWKMCGSLNVARTKNRLDSYHRSVTCAKNSGIEAEMISSNRAKEIVPQLHTNDLLGAVWIPHDGVVNPTDLCAALVKKSKEMGVRFYEHCEVNRVLTRNNEVRGVDSESGMIECRYFVNCSGMWARQIGQLSEPSVRVPLHACEHFYLVTKPMGIDNMMPVVRDYDGYVYLREWSGGILGGGFEPYAKTCFHDQVPDKFEFQLLNEDWDHFQILLEQLLHRLPALADGEVRQMVNGPESFTPDARYILGEAPEIENYFVAAGMNSSGVAAAGGIGKYLAEWMVEGRPSIDMWSLDIRRFIDMHNNKKFLQDRVTEVLGKSLAGLETFDHEQTLYSCGRTRRMSPLYARHEEDAIWGQYMGFERPLYFNSSGTRRALDYTKENYNEFFEGSDQQEETFGKPQWFDKVKAEYWACRESVCLIDMSTFSKFELMSGGDEVVRFLQYICSNDIDKPVGTVVHTGMQNHQGGYENDCSVVRMAENKFFMICPTNLQTRALAWMNQHKPPDGSVQINDVTSMYTAINVIGPKAQELLGELTDTPLDTKDFFSMSCKEIDVAQASNIKAIRLTHSGEDGWVLYIPSEYALHVYDSLMAVGKHYGLRNAGYYALRALRTEKFFAYWGSDLTPYVTPLESGREYRVKYDVGNFIGHGALLTQRRQGIKRKLVQFLLDDHDLESDIWPWGGEPIYRNGKYTGSVSSTAYGFSLDRHVCLGFVHDFDDKTGEANVITNDFILKNAKFSVEINGKMFSAKAGIYPPKLASAEIVLSSKHKATRRR